MPLPYKISHTPIEYISPEKEALFYNLREQARKGKRGIIEKLLKNIKKYPHETSLKNYLYVAYTIKGRHDAALKTLHQTIKLHPDYLFVKLNLAEEYIKEEKYEKVPELLGEKMELEVLYPDQEVFHVTEVVSFFSTTALYFMGIGELEEAERRLKVIGEVEPDNPHADFLMKKLAAARLMKMMEKMKKDQQATIEVESFPTVEYEATTEPPALRHEISRKLYQHSETDFPEDLIASIMALPKESLIQDLEVIVLDAIKRVDWFQDNYTTYNESEQVFQTHAIYFLAALEASESLPVIFDLLRQGEEFLTYWFGDELENIFKISLYWLGRNNLSELKDFVLKPDLYWAARLSVVLAVAQIAHHQPEREEEVIDWFKDVFQYHLDHPDKKGIIDTHFIAWSVSQFAKLEVSEEIPLIQKLWDKKWIPEHILGDFEIIRADMVRPKPKHNHHKSPIPRNINEFYSKAYLDRQVKRPITLEDKELFENMKHDLEHNSVIKQFASILGTEQSFAESPSLYETDDRSQNEQKYLPNTNSSLRSGRKIGRNEPCPCGSGRKYKKCCLNK